MARATIDWVELVRLSTLYHPPMAVVLCMETRIWADIYSCVRPSLSELKEKLSLFKESLRFSRKCEIPPNPTCLEWEVPRLHQFQISPGNSSDWQFWGIPECPLGPPSTWGGRKKKDRPYRGDKGNIYPGWSKILATHL